MILSKDDVERYLALAKAIKGNTPWIDIHVSPFEVIFNSFRYSASKTQPGIHSIDDSAYQAPTLSPIMLEAKQGGPRKELDHEESIPLSTFLYRKNYAHIGPRVLGDQMRVSGIEKSVILPVLHPESDGVEEMELVCRLYGMNDSYILGYCIPNGVANRDVLNAVRSAMARYGAKIIKVHPNITGIDLSSDIGLERIEAFFEAANYSGLPLVMHGGISPVIKNRSARAYSSLPNLLRVNWKLISKPVIISHAGMMGATVSEIERELLPLLRRILSLNDEIMIDISALGSSALCLILKTIEPDRILFGSDCQYYPQWGAIVKLIHSLKTATPVFEDRFLQIVARNAARIVPRKGEM